MVTRTAQRPLRWYQFRLRTLVAAGHGYTVLSHSAVLEDLAAGRLAAARLKRPVIRRPIYLARNPTRAITRASVHAEDLLVSLLAGMISEAGWQAEWIADGTGPSPHAA